jgi:hypothetical protein
LFNWLVSVSPSCSEPYGAGDEVVLLDVAIVIVVEEIVELGTMLLVAIVVLGNVVMVLENSVVRVTCGTGEDVVVLDDHQSGGVIGDVVVIGPVVMEGTSVVVVLDDHQPGGVVGDVVVVGSIVAGAGVVVVEEDDVDGDVDDDVEVAIEVAVPDGSLHAVDRA